VAEGNGSGDVWPMEGSGDGGGGAIISDDPLRVGGATCGGEVGGAVCAIAFLIAGDHAADGGGGIIRV